MLSIVWEPPHFNVILSFITSKDNVKENYLCEVTVGRWDLYDYLILNIFAVVYLWILIELPCSIIFWI